MDKGRVFVATGEGIEVVVPPLEDVYSVGAGGRLEITVRADDPDNDILAYAMENMPDYGEAEFTDNGDGTALFVWEPAEDQVGTYDNISFTAFDGHQETVSKDITIIVEQRDEHLTPEVELIPSE
jgi:hypothetical protein